MRYLVYGRLFNGMSASGTQICKTDLTTKLPVMWVSIWFQLYTVLQTHKGPLGFQLSFSWGPPGFPAMTSGGPGPQFVNYRSLLPKKTEVALKYNGFIVIPL